MPPAQAPAQDHISPAPAPTTTTATTPAAAPAAGQGQAPPPYQTEKKGAQSAPGGAAPAPQQQGMPLTHLNESPATVVCPKCFKQGTTRAELAPNGSTQYVPSPQFLTH